MSDISDLGAEREAIERLALEDDGIHTYPLTASDAVAALAPQLRRGKEAEAAVLRLTDEYARVSDEKRQAFERITALEADNNKLNEEIMTYQVSGEYEKGHEHGSAAAVKVVKEARAERDALRAENERLKRAVVHPVACQCHICLDRESLPRMAVENVKLATQLRMAEAENERLRGVLAFYADIGNQPVLGDDGRVAREALAENDPLRVVMEFEADSDG